MWPLSISVVFLPCFAAFLLTALSSAYGYGDSEATCSGIVPLKYRNDKISITDFGGVGDGRTVNTKAFRAAIYRIQHLRRRGGTVLYIPPGVFLTESFSLTSHMTLFLARGAVIKAVQVPFFQCNKLFVSCLSAFTLAASVSGLSLSMIIKLLGQIFNIKIVRQKWIITKVVVLFFLTACLDLKFENVNKLIKLDCDKKKK